MRCLNRTGLLLVGLALCSPGQEMLCRNGVELYCGCLFVVTDELDREEWSLKDWLQDAEVACDKWLEFLVIRTNADRGPSAGPSLLVHRNSRYAKVRVEVLDATGRRVERTEAGKTMDVSPPAGAGTVNITNWFKVQGKGPFLLEAQLYYYRWTNGQYRRFLSDPVRLRVVCPTNLPTAQDRPGAEPKR